MKCCELTLANPEENLACDEVLLELGEAGSVGPVLRFWEPSQYFVVVGYANRTTSEVNREFCQRHDIPVLRRCSGGGAVLQGPGCLNYSLVLPIQEQAQLEGIAGTNDYVLQRHQRALQALLRAPVEKQGHTDLTIGGLKFSGNSQRRKKRFLLFHGSFLLHADIELIEKVLPQPSHQPAYRMNRSHSDFLMNLKIPASLLKSALIKAWEANEPLTQLPLDQVTRLAAEKYHRDSWNYKF
jgi:lipoate-protein ligase A